MVTYNDGSSGSMPCFKFWNKSGVMIMDFIETANGLYCWDMDDTEPKLSNKPPAKTGVESGVV